MPAVRRALSARGLSDGSGGRCNSARGARSLCGSTLSLGSLMRAQRPADGRVWEEFGRREPSMAQQWCGQSVQHAKELDHWTARVREQREQTHRCDAKLEDALRDARGLQRELQLGKAELVRLRAEAERTALERSRWEGQLEVSRSCIRKLEARVVSLHRLGASQLDSKHPQRLPPEAERLEIELQDLLAQRERLLGEKESLERAGRDQEREIRILSQSLGVVPSMPSTASTARASDVLRHDLRVSQEEAETLRLRLEATHLEVSGLKAGRTELADELLATISEGEGHGADHETLENSEAEARIAGAEAEVELERARSEEEAACLEAAALYRELQESEERIEAERATRAAALRTTEDIEASLAAIRKQSAAADSKAKAETRELEAQAAALRGELEDQRAAHRQELARRAAKEAEAGRLGDELGRLQCELADEEAAGRRLEGKISAAEAACTSHDRELRREEAHGATLAGELADAERQDEDLRKEVDEERERAQGASGAAAALLGQRQRVADEAAEALRSADLAMRDGDESAQALRHRDEQLARSERSCELMRATLGQRLSAVHEQVRRAESANARAVLELREERQEHQRLRSRLLEENSRRRSLVHQPPRAPGPGQPRRRLPKA